MESSINLKGLQPIAFYKTKKLELENAIKLALRVGASVKQLNKRLRSVKNSIKKLSGV